MLRLIFWLLLIFIIGFAGVMAARYDFPITASIGEYDIETSAARIAVISIFAITVIYGLIRLVFWLKNSPRRVLRRIKKENEEQGLKNIMNGFSALAAGNPQRAKKFADKANKALPKQPLVKLLQAQVAVYQNDKETAAEYYRALTQTEEGQFVGFRGLISQAMNENQPQKALKIADELLVNNPKSAWLNEALIDLAFRTEDWAKLERYLKKAEANKALDKEKLNEKLSVYYFMKAKLAKADVRVEDAKWLAQRSLKYNSGFLPAALFLSNLYVETEEYKKAAILIEKMWKTQPHPQFMKNFEMALLNRGIRTKAKRVKKLFERNPDDVESSIFYARTLIEERHSGEAREIISHGLKIRETRALCELMAQIDDKVAWLNRAEKAKDDKCWYCKITGARYTDWQLYSDSGELNTITWGFPPEAPKSLLNETKFLFS